MPIFTPSYRVSSVSGTAAFLNSLNAELGDLLKITSEAYKLHITKGTMWTMPFWDCFYNILVKDLKIWSEMMSDAEKTASLLLFQSKYVDMIDGVDIRHMLN